MSFIVISVILSFFAAPAVSGKCIDTGEQNLNLDQLFWSEQPFIYQHNTTFSITFDLCHQNSCHSGALICAHSSTKSFDIGKLLTNTSMQYEETVLEFSSDDTSVLAETGCHQFTTFIFFTCDKTSLGVPLLLNNPDCVYYFEWKTLAACRGSIADEVHQVPCYLFEEGELYDLGPLVDTNTAHAVSTLHDEERLMINLCRNISFPPSAPCEGNSASCSADGVDLGTSWGFVDKNTKFEKKVDHLTYKLTATGGKSTEILLYCSKPKDGQLPTEVSNSGTNRVIQWRTVHACPRKEKVNAASCKYDNFDLTALNKTYNVSTDGEYSYELALCGRKLTHCGNESALGPIVGCRKKDGDKTYKQIIGRGGLHSFFRYSDDGLRLLMTKGVACSSGYQREIIINFICDNNIPLGEPQFRLEQNCSYVFDWHTKLACETKPSCKYTSSTGVSYDFSSLTVSGSATIWSANTDTGKAYLNICGGVGEIEHCNYDSSVCHSNSTGNQNWGLSSTGQFSEKSSDIVLTYSQGDNCSINQTVSTEIYLKCANIGTHGSAPAYLPDPSSSCKKIFEIHTKAACAPSNPTTGCKLNSSSTDYVYELSSLGTLTSPESANYTINMCTRMSCSKNVTAYICKNGSAIASHAPNFAENGQDQVTVTFKPDGGKLTQLHLHCNHTANIARVTAASNEGSIQAFDVDTSLVCAPKPVQCAQLTDTAGHQFDISKLADQQFTAVDRFNNMMYYFSVCGHLTQPTDCANKFGAINVCQKTSSNEFVDLGYIASSPTVTSDNGKYKILIHAINGKPCGHGDKSSRQTFITMICSDDEYAPLVIEDANCNYDITWRTKNACPIDKDAVSAGCKISMNNDKYDLCSLKDKELNFNNGNAKIKVFGNFTTPDDCSGSSVCIKKNGQFKGMGSIVKDKWLEVLNGHITLAMPGQSCGIQSVTSFLTFYCPTTSQPDGTSQYETVGSCLHQFKYYTTFACAPVESTVCSIQAPDGFHDLTSLMLHDSNYRAVGRGNFSSEQYFINICHRINPTPDTKDCPPRSAACRKDKDGNFTSLGQLQPNTSPLSFFSGNEIIIQYKDGDVCPKNSSRLLETVINIQCDIDQTTPSLMTREHSSRSYDCRIDFSWRSAAACLMTKNNITCQQIGVHQSTMATQYKVESKNHYYYINFPCGQREPSFQKMNKCGDTDEFGVCQISKASNEAVVAGLKTTSAQKLEDGTFQFNYTDGVTCAHDVYKRSRNVLLTIYCSPNADDETELEFAGETAEDCTYRVSWGRQDVCNEHVSCQVSSSGEGVIDLSPLGGRPNLQVTSGAEGDIWLDVCKPLGVIEENLSCPPSSAVCIRKPDGTILGLGNYDTNPVLNPDTNSVTLTYNSKTKCRDNKNFTSVITFTCSPDSIGSPQLMTSGDECVYRFTWQTMLVCQTNDGGNTPANTSDCHVTHAKSGYSIDLTPLKLQPDIQVSNSSYKLSVCRHLHTSPCSANTVVCQTKLKKSYGLIGLNEVISSTLEGVDLQYDGEDCNGQTGDKEKHISMISFICDKTVGIGRPELVKTEHDCQARFRWRTSVVCVPECEYTLLNHTYNFQHLNNHRSNYKITRAKNAYDLNICRGLTQTKCGNSSELDVSVCLTQADQSQQPLTFSNTITIEHWGDDNFGLVQYGYNKSLCLPKENIPTVLIHVYCSNKLADPTFVEFFEQNCTHIFKWPTPVACHSQTMKESEVKLMPNGSFVDPTQTKMFDLSPLVNKLHTANDGSFDYYFKLSGVISNNSLGINPDCTDGKTSVCQHDVNTKRPIGKTHPTYYYKDDELQVFYKSDSTCGRFVSLTTTVRIHLPCNESTKELNPQFHYESRACLYVLSLPTSSLCHPRILPKPSTGSGLAGGAIAVIIIVTLLVAAILFTIVFKLHRRRRLGYNQSVGYSRVNHDDDSSLLINSNHPRYADDDDDLII